MDLVVCLVDRAAEPLTVRLEHRRLTIRLRSVSLNQKAVVRWLERHGIPWSTEESGGSGELPHASLIQLRTAVICVDSRVHDMAQLYAQAVGVPCYFAQNADEVFAIIEQAEAKDSVSLFLLNDQLEEELCHAIAIANRARSASGRVPLSYGFFTAFTPEHLAWMIVKTWVMFLRPYPERLGFARFDFATGESLVHFRATTNGATTIGQNSAPWLDDDIAVLGLRAHGASFDVSMGRVVLCGKLDPPLPRERTQRAPSCFHDNNCFRLSQPHDAPEEVLKAVAATPLVWCLDSCASVPLTGNAFGEGTSYVFGLIAGAAVGVIGPFLDITTAGLMNRQCEALLAGGATLGETAAAACSTKETVGFDRFLLIGSPDLRLLPANQVQPQIESGRWRFALRGESQYAWRLALPSELTPPVYVVADDGGEHWTTAKTYTLERAGNHELLVTLAEPANVDGWLVAGVGGNSNDWFRREAMHIHDNLEVLKLCPFVDAKLSSIENCQRLAKLLRRVIRVSDRLRCRQDLAILWANLHAAINEVQLDVADRFLKQVAEHDVNLDRVPGQGFILEPTRRITDRCQACGVHLYETLALWRWKRTYVRRWLQCVNCSGVAMVLQESPLVISGVTATASVDGSSLSISMSVANRTETPLQAVIAGLRRRSSVDDASGPAVMTLLPNSSESFTFETPLDRERAGVVSYRLLVLCNAGVELFALKHVVEPTSPVSIGMQLEADLSVFSNQ